MPWSRIVTSVAEAEAGISSGEISLPAIVRPAFTLGGHGGGVGNTATELAQVVSEGLAASPINQVLVEESVLGWGEFELEVMRDRNDNVVIICSIENVDPMGSTPGLGHDRSGPDAHRLALPGAPGPGDQRDPRRRGGDRRFEHPVRGQRGDRRGGGDRDEPEGLASSALASKATGFPIAKIAAQLAVGYALEEIPNDITRRRRRPSSRRSTTSSPRCPLRLREVPRRRGRLSTHMKSVGEAMAIGRTFRESFAKAMRSRELDAAPDIPASTGELLERLASPSSDRST